MNKEPQELADFGAISSSKLTPELTFKHFDLLATALEWMAIEGRKILESAEPLDFQTWNWLFERSFQIYCAGGSRFTFEHQFAMVVERGISALQRFTEDHLQEIRDRRPGTVVWEQWNPWFETIEYQLRMGARLGLHSETNSSPSRTITLLRQLADIAQLAHHESCLHTIAVDLYPAYDKKSREMFVKAHKTW